MIARPIGASAIQQSISNWDFETLAEREGFYAAFILKVVRYQPEFSPIQNGGFPGFSGSRPVAVKSEP